MADIDSRFIAFENDHTYLKTPSKECKNLQSLENRSIKITEVRATAPTDSLCDKTKKKTNVIDMNQYSLSQAIDILSGPNSKVFFLPPAAPSTIPVAPKVVSLKNRVPVYKEKKRVEKCILPKTSTPIKVMPATNPNNLLYFIPPTTPLNVGFQNSRKSSPGKPVSAVPRIEKVVVRPAQGRKVMNDNNSGVCKIKLTNKLMKRIQNGEKLFMCLECDKIYLEHWRLLEHQKTHTKCEKNDLKERIVFVERKKNPDEQEEENSYDYRRDEDFFDNHSTNLSSIPKKPKMFKGECIICHSVFLDLGKHLETFHQNDLIKNSSHQCFKCDLQFDAEEDLQMHKLTVHRNGNVYSCESCFKEFSSEKDLEAHMLTHNTDNMKYLCPYCDAGFSLSVGLRAHLTKHIGNSAEKPTFESSPHHQVENSLGRPPEQLDQLFADLDNISDNVNGVYVEQVANDNYRVRIVKNHSDNKQSPNEFVDSDPINDNSITNNVMPLETIENNMELQPQLTSNGRKKRVSYTVCRICLMIVSYSRIGRHMRKKHNSAAPYQCEICHADFNRKHLMDDHRRKHTNNKPHKCSECNKCFAYKHHRNRHMMLVHNSDTLDKPFQCTMCDKSFSFKEYLTLHVNSRHTGKRYMCQICGKSFPTNAGLNKHQLCHTDERPFMCEQCGRTFKCKTHCDTHKKNIHPGDVDLSVEQEKFECNLCNKTFTTKVYRDMHFKRHNGQGHQCSICFKLFVSKAHMQRHIKIMH